MEPHLLEARIKTAITNPSEFKLVQRPKSEFSKIIEMIMQKISDFFSRSNTSPSLPQNEEQVKKADPVQNTSDSATTKNVNTILKKMGLSEQLDLGSTPLSRLLRLREIWNKVKDEASRQNIPLDPNRVTEIDGLVAKSLEEWYSNPVT